MEIYALAWALIHSLWQGVLVALAAALGLWLMRFRSAKVRYWFVYSALVTLLVWVVATFIGLYEGQKWLDTEGVLFSQNATDDTTWQTLQVVGNQSFIEEMWAASIVFLNTHVGAIALTWAVGFLFFGLQLAYSWWALAGRQRRGGVALDAHWQNVLRQLQRQLSIARPIQLVEAAWVQLPLTIGWLKPMIFMPIGLVNRLNPSEVEAILAHELAHIAARDYLFNFLQVFIEVLLYYNPAVWWLSSVIRSEREMRCDAAAVQLCGGNALAYAQTLVKLQEQFDTAHTATSQLALTFGKRPSPLLRRVKRLFNSPIQQSTIMEKMMITGMLLAGMFLFSFTQNRSNTEGVLAPQSQQLTDVPTLVAPPLNQANNQPTGKPQTLVLPELVALDSSPKKKDATFEMFVPSTGEVRKVTVVGQSQEEFDKNQKNIKKDDNPWIIYTTEFRKNDKEWKTLRKTRSDLGTKIDTIDWTAKSDYMKEGKWDDKSNLLSENDPNMNVLEEELLKDGLIKNRKQYSLILSQKGFSISDERMEKVYSDKYKQLYKKLFSPSVDLESDFGFQVFKRDTAKKGLLTYGRDDKPEKAKPGHCYAKCNTQDGKPESWREILCEEKITTDFVRKLVAKLKASGDLATSIESNELTKDIRRAVWAYQTRNKLPMGNFNLATMEHMGLNP
jgi:beta-lactamase regulating signal transducer with metallopeptidase domain